MLKCFILHLSSYLSIEIFNKYCIIKLQYFIKGRI
nr:MAG TPA: hypothetical protein [Caudoviricetes sp.]